MDVQVHKAFRIPNKHGQKRPSPHHFIVKILRVENKERITGGWKREVSGCCKGRPIRIIASMLAESLKDLSTCTNVFHALK
jgi:hypothetical protein